MKKKTKHQYRSDITLCLGESLFEGQGLATIEGLLRQIAADWASDLHIYREEEKTPRRDIDDFATDVRATALERGPLYQQLVAKHGPGPFPRRCGTVELRGADDSLIVVLDLDDHLFAPSAGRWLWANTVSVQICRPRVAGDDAAQFMRHFAESACTRLSPWYGFGAHLEEWDQKNTSHEGGGTMRIGADASRYLPGLYWLNFFGEPYCTLIGKHRLLGAPAHEVEELDAGVLLLLAPEPGAWSTPEYKAVEKRVLMHVGDKYFFNRNEPQGDTVAPDFGLESLPRNPRFS